MLKYQKVIRNSKRDRKGDMRSKNPSFYELYHGKGEKSIYKITKGRKRKSRDLD